MAKFVLARFSAQQQIQRNRSNGNFPPHSVVLER